jgi:hypothetical protein
MTKALQSVILTILFGFSPVIVARDGSSNVSSACATLEFMAKMVALNILLPNDRDDLRQLRDTNSYLLMLNSLVCQSAVLTGSSRGASYYTDGTLVSTDLYYRAWYFANGQLFMSEPGADVTIYYPNGRPMAYHWIHGGEPLFWPNGMLATGSFRTFDVTWNYPDGHIITYQAGLKGGRWFYPFARLDGGRGQEVLSSEWGIENESFTYLNFRSNGSIYLTRERIRRKLIFDDIDLLDVPGVLLVITRLYNNNDSARQFVPADANITGAPF